VFAGDRHRDISSIKNIFKGILARTKNDEEIKEPYQGMLKELLKYHDKGEDKLKGLKFFTVNIHPEYKDTRCFFAVKEDGKKEDFSSVKCINNLEKSLEEEDK